MHNKLKSILNKLLSGDLSCLNTENICIVSNEALRILNKDSLDEYDKMNTDSIISISQIVYNNTDRNILFLEDGVYDLLLERCKEYNKNFQVGSPVVRFDNNGEEVLENGFIEPFKVIENSEEFFENSLYKDDLFKTPKFDPRLYQDIDRNSGKIISKKNVNVPHMYPKLVGSLDKCKFVLDKEAIDRGVYDNESVTIFERDFLAKHLQMGLIDMNTPFEMIAELKYDGISVEADVTNKILSARSRGDANADIAADLTEVLGGYRFLYAPEMDDSEAFGMKFEAIITYANLQRMSELRGKGYKNSRNGIIGLFGSSDAYDYRDLITLIPLATSIEDIDRVTEIEFLNKYYHSGEYLIYSILRGTYTEILFQVYKFVKEAEAIRPIMPYMFDGVVISYRDPKIIKALGRENSINKYSVAIKFNPLVRQAIFTGYTYTVGQDGVITPMIHYTPVEFYGTIHTKSSGHSYKRFMDLGLAVGDVLSIEYTNDVMPYVSKAESNLINNNPIEQFPTHCPFCGTPIVINKSGKSAICPNIECPERVVCKVANMMSKLNIKDFSEERLRILNTKSLSDLLNYTYDDVSILGPVNAEKLMERINELKTNPINDYKLVGSLGFTGVAIETWKKILTELPLEPIIYLNDGELFFELRAIKGIGDITAQLIVDERKYFMKDLEQIQSMSNVIRSFGAMPQPTIRFTGCRPDEDLYNYLTNLGYDANPNGGVTRSTNILVVPYIGYTSNKLSKVGPQTIIVDMAAFKSNPDKYLL